MSNAEYWKQWRNKVPFVTEIRKGFNAGDRNIYYDADGRLYLFDQNKEKEFSFMKESNDVRLRVVFASPKPRSRHSDAIDEEFMPCGGNPIRLSNSIGLSMRAVVLSYYYFTGRRVSVVLIKMM